MGSTHPLRPGSNDRVPLMSSSVRIAYGSLVALGMTVALPAAVDYDREIAPLLSEHCLNCHGPDEKQRKGKLRLDQRESATHAAKSGEIAIVPGHPEKSVLVSRLLTQDADEKMPPAKEHKDLTAAQVRLLETWIKEGAPYADHWSFSKLQRPAPPTVQDTHWVRNPVDLFILQKLEQNGLKPVPAANASTLLRRMSFGTTGLPPTPEEITAFSNPSDDAGYRQLLDAKLSSTQYGEHWARHWMDVVRYGDSAGYELDYLFTHSWRYRDWLIRSFAKNKPMDQFIREQVAGDQLHPGDAEAADAVLLLTVGPWRFEGGIQRSKNRDNYWLTDVADTTSAAFLGVTMACTRCHDHKFDPWTQADYYGLQAIFSESDPKEERVGKGGGPGDARPSFMTIVARTGDDTVQILRRGEVDLPIGPAKPSLPAILPEGGPLASRQARRSTLASWLTSPRNPLTARVMVNRVWQWHFGQGLVRTANDFGVRGDTPSHPELLDWLAAELVESGWNLGHLQRLILDSATYRQGSAGAGLAAERDPTHRLLAGFPRQRLQAEQLRDAMLQASGTLNLKSFGSPVVPPVEPWALAALRNKNWSPTKDAAELNRRSVYLVVRRSIKLPFFDVFNGPDTISSCSGRDTTVVPAQALTMLNSQDTLIQAKLLASRLWSESKGQPSAAILKAWPLLFARPVTREEINEATTFIAAREQAWLKSAPTAALSWSPVKPDPATHAREAAWIEWCLALLNTNEFLYVD